MKRKINYYHQLVNNWYDDHIPTQKNILVFNENIILSNHKKHFIYSNLHEIPIHIKIDYIILSQTLHEIADIQEFLISLKHICSSSTRIIIDTYCYIWEPILWIAQKIGLRKKTSIRHWLTQRDIKNFLHLSDYEYLAGGKFMLLPIYIPVVSWLVNCIAHLPLINKLCLVEWALARPKNILNAHQLYSVSVIVPCKNEAGNIKHIVKQMPNMGAWTEIIFVEGGSIDDTKLTILKQITQHPDKHLVYINQSKSGKKNAVYEGFAKARGDIIMILDADATVAPCELKKFYSALASNKGEFINGSRLVYGMEPHAMRFLNMLANHFFATIFSWILSQSIKDTLCGTKVFFKKELKEMFSAIQPMKNLDPFGDFDLLFGAAKINLKIIDLPIHYKARTYGNTQIRRFYHGLMLLKMSFVGAYIFKLNSIKINKKTYFLTPISHSNKTAYSHLKGHG